MNKMLVMLVLLCGCDKRQDHDISSLFIRVIELEKNQDRIRECISRLTTDMRVEDVVMNLTACVR